jgi:hypothetical protein
LYFNTTDGVMKVYTASGWIAASSASVATLATFEFVATSGQTVFTGNDANGASLSYVAPALIVTLNGVRLRPGDDYTATNGTSITLISAAALNDELVVDAFGSFLVANTYTIAQTDAGFVAKTSATGAANLPSGTTAQRPGSPTTGQTRFNTSLGSTEIYNGSNWQTLVGSGTTTTYNVEHLIAAGGGGGGRANGGGGGGGGGVLINTISLTSGTAYTVTIGAGGAGSTSTRGSSGSNSVFGSVTATGGGGGGGADTASDTLIYGLTGGSAGGSATYNGRAQTIGVAGTAGQGNNSGGGSSDNSTFRLGGGGGGGGGNGETSSNQNGSGGGNGGSGIISAISGTPAAYGGGGGGGCYYPASTAAQGGLGGLGGGGNGGWINAVNSGGGASGAANSGGGGGGQGDSGVGVGSGGSGVVIISYAGPQRGTGGTITSVAGNTIHTFTTSGTFTA